MLAARAGRWHGLGSRQPGRWPWGRLWCLGSCDSCSRLPPGISSPWPDPCDRAFRFVGAARARNRKVCDARIRPRTVERDRPTPGDGLSVGFPLSLGRDFHYYYLARVSPIRTSHKIGSAEYCPAPHIYHRTLRNSSGKLRSPRTPCHRSFPRATRRRGPQLHIIDGRPMRH